MKYDSKTVRVSSYVAAVCAVASAMIVAVLLLLSAAGVIFPRREKITLHTDTVSKIYDATPLTGGEMTMVYGELHQGHELVMISMPSYTDVGEYDNAPKYMIVDSSGDDVTGMYDVQTDFGKIVINGIPLSVFSESKNKQYDGQALISDEIKIMSGQLAEGHTFICDSTTYIIMPGEQQILPSYRIVDKNGKDVAGQYHIVEHLGTLTVVPLPVTVVTGSAEKNYDGKPLSESKWEHVSGTLLDGHSLVGRCITEEIEVGTYKNEIEASVIDESGKDVTEIYGIKTIHGEIRILPMSLHIRTADMTKEYDGTPLKCEEWSIVSGGIGEGERLTVTRAPTLNEIGTVANKMDFVITDKNGVDVTHRYQIKQYTGSLSLTPRSITIRTGSASKVYDGTPLTCEEYQITSGSLSEGDRLNVALTSIVNVGYTQNYIIDYSILRESEDGRTVNVTSNYRVSFDYGTLTVTMK